MPGGLHAPTAETLPKGAVQVSTLTGLGRRTGLLGPDHKFNRAIGDIAFGFGVTDMISIGLSLDGRYDKHWGSVGDSTKNLMTTTPAGGDDGYVGDPHVYIRAGKSTGSLIVGGQLGVWVPGKDAPSVAGSAISVDVRGIVSLPAGPGLLSFSAGFRLDNSAKSVDEPMKLSLSDRVSLGVSDYNAVIGSAQLRIPAGKAWVGIEGSIDAFVGGPADPAMGEIGHAKLARGAQLFRGREGPSGQRCADRRREHSARSIRAALRRWHRPAGALRRTEGCEVAVRGEGLPQARAAGLSRGQGSDPRRDHGYRRRHGWQARRRCEGLREPQELAGRADSHRRQGCIRHQGRAHRRLGRRQGIDR
jgi:hypothetical protein